MAQSLLDYLADELVTVFNVDREAVTPHTTLEDLGLDSLALLELTVRFEDRTGVELPETEDAGLGTRSTLTEICVALEKALPDGRFDALVLREEAQ
ncbi:acyl carrier protein [Streptomyces sp. NPDC046261]|uniref:acyl carrier protein n=1 Tax=Streptomyces sp. NPDC046261 TaxID=3157200 RepID=UPI003402FCCA